MNSINDKGKPMENEDFLNAPQVHISRSQTGALGLFDHRGMMKMPLIEGENPERIAREMGWRLVSA